MVEVVDVRWPESVSPDGKRASIEHFQSQEVDGRQF